MRSWEVWLMLIRNTSAPASNSPAITSGSEDAGPSVATILLRRSRLIGPVILVRGGVGEAPAARHWVESGGYIGVMVVGPLVRRIPSAARSRISVRQCRLRRSRFGHNRGRDNPQCPEW